jgi:phosphatidate cytidylyltransferase
MELQRHSMHHHGLILAIYASLAAPFGGFFASALKRAKGVKDFDQWIPGHGGMTDRMDCHLLMGLFTLVYLHAIS